MKLNNDQLHLSLRTLIAGVGIDLNGNKTTAKQVKQAVQYIQNLISGKPYTVEYKNSYADDFFGEGTTYKQDALKLALQRAVEVGEVDFVKTYLKAYTGGAETGYTLSVFEQIKGVKEGLRLAVQCGQVKVLKILLEHMKIRAITLTLQDRQDLLERVSADQHRDKILKALGYGNTPTTARREEVKIGGLVPKTPRGGLEGIVSLQHKEPHPEPPLMLKSDISTLPALMHESFVKNREGASSSYDASSSDDVFFSPRTKISGNQGSDLRKTNVGNAGRHPPIQQKVHKK